MKNRIRNRNNNKNRETKDDIGFHNRLRSHSSSNNNYNYYIYLPVVCPAHVEHVRSVLSLNNAIDQLLLLVIRLQDIT